MPRIASSNAIAGPSNLSRGAIRQNSVKPLTPLGKSKSKSRRPPREGHCANCGCQSAAQTSSGTTLWRTNLKMDPKLGGADKNLCNACGIWQATKGEHRPPQLWKTKPKLSHTTGVIGLSNKEEQGEEISRSKPNSGKRRREGEDLERYVGEREESEDERRSRVRKEIEVDDEDDTDDFDDEVHEEKDEKVLAAAEVLLSLRQGGTGPQPKRPWTPPPPAFRPSWIYNQPSKHTPPIALLPTPLPSPTRDSASSLPPILLHSPTSPQNDWRLVTPSQPFIPLSGYMSGSRDSKPSSIFAQCIV